MTHAIADSQGLICAFELGPVTMRDHDLLETTAIERPRSLNINLVDTR